MRRLQELSAPAHHLGKLIATHAGTCPKIRSSLHLPDRGPGFADDYEKLLERQLSAVTTRKRTARPQKMPKCRRSALPWTLDDLLKMGKARLPR